MRCARLERSDDELDLRRVDDDGPMADELDPLGRRQSTAHAVGEAFAVLGPKEVS